MHATVTLTPVQKILVQAMIGRMCVDEAWAQALFDQNREGATRAIQGYIDRFSSDTGVVLQRAEAEVVTELVLRYTEGTSPDRLMYAILEVARLAKCPRWPCPDVS